MRRGHGASGGEHAHEGGDADDDEPFTGQEGHEEYEDEDTGDHPDDPSIASHQRVGEDVQVIVRAVAGPPN